MIAWGRTSEISNPSLFTMVTYWISSTIVTWTFVTRRS